VRGDHAIDQPAGHLFNRFTPTCVGIMFPPSVAVMICRLEAPMWYDDGPADPAAVTVVSVETVIDTLLKWTFSGPIVNALPPDAAFEARWNTEPLTWLSPIGVNEVGANYIVFSYAGDAFDQWRVLTTPANVTPAVETGSGAVE
jgi:hypothetical protein